MTRMLTSQEKTVFRFFVGVLLVGLVVGYVRKETTDEPLPEFEQELADFSAVSDQEFAPGNPVSDDSAQGNEFTRSIRMVNINSAGKKELMSLPKIGPVTAERIMRFREDFGNFQDFEDLTKVKGIGSKTIEIIRPYVEF